MIARVLLPLLIATVGCDAAQAQDFEPASIQTIHDEARYLDTLDGPEPGSHRAIYIWRAPSTPASVLLPTLYMADGGNGVYVATARLRPAIEAGLIPAVQIIGMAPDLRNRMQEYAQPGRPRFRAHEQWVLNVVIPWAERVARASPQQRAIGGYSNGADFALAMGAAHPDVFSAVLAHSPLTTETLRVDARAANVRWALSAGRVEYNGLPFAVLGVADGAARSQGAAVRVCTGGWGHNGDAWIDLSPGAIAWLFNFPAAADVASPLERTSCRVSERAH